MDKLQFVPAPSCSMPQIRSPQEYFEMYQQVVADLPYSAIEQAIEELLRAYESGRSIFTFGNGGSAATASHFACDLSKGTVIGDNGHKRFRVMALTDNVPLMTAWANDGCYEGIFAEQLQNFVTSGDVVFAISGSGNSPNVLQALKLARDAGATTIGLTGFKGGKMAGLSDICVIIPSDNMQIIEDFHVSVAHAVFSVIRQRISEDMLVPPLAASGGAD